MSSPNRTVAYGRFEKRDGHIFRTEAWLQWGESEELKGLLVMLNPGASKLINETDWQALENGQIASGSGAIVIDQTMKAVIEIINEAFPNDFSGKLEIRNLFNLRNGNIDRALETYKHIHSTVEPEILHAEFEEKPFVKWVWMGWGYDSRSLLKQRKEFVYKKIKAWELPTYSVTKPDKEQYLVGHVRPHLAQMRKIYKDEIVRQLQKLGQPSKSFSVK